MIDKTKESTSPQYQKFKEAAREVETDDREAAFDAIVKKIAKTPPKENPPATPGPVKRLRRQTAAKG